MAGIQTVQIQIPSTAQSGDVLTFLVNGTEMELQVPDGSEPGDTLEIQVALDHEHDNDNGDNNDNKPTNHSDATYDSHEDEDNECVGDGDQNKLETVDETHEITLVEKSTSTSIPIQLVLRTALPDIPENNQGANGDDNGDGNSTSGDGTHSFPWPAGIHLARYLASPSAQSWLSGVHFAVEVGSGLGIGGLGMLASALLCQDGRNQNDNKVNPLVVLFTDVPTALPLLRYNVEINRLALSIPEQQRVRVLPLVWGEVPVPAMVEEVRRAAVLELEGDVVRRVVLGSDLLYDTNPYTYRALSRTIYGLVTGDLGDAVATTDTNAPSTTESKSQTDNKPPTKSESESIAILSIRWRKPDLERIFFQQMERLGFTFQLLTTSTTTSASPFNPKFDSNNLTWKEFGNPNSSISNQYFTQTHVSVRGVSKSLSDVMASERDMEIMSQEEYEEFESRFVQIYVARLSSSSSS